MKRREFLKAMVAAPVAVQAFSWDQIFLKDDGKEVASNHLPLGYIIRRHAVSLGAPPVPEVMIFKHTKEALMNWVLDNKLGRYAKNFRFSYMVDDFNNKLGIGIAVYNSPREDVGMTWGQMIRELTKKGLIKWSK